MATTKEYIEYVCEQISGTGQLDYKKMFGEYMVYLNDKPVIIVCDNIPYVKDLPVIREDCKDAKKGFPYRGAKEHYVLDIDNADLSKKIVLNLEKVIPIPKSRKK